MAVVEEPACIGHLPNISCVAACYFMKNRVEALLDSPSDGFAVFRFEIASYPAITSVNVSGMI